MSGFWSRARRHPSFMIGLVLTVLLIAAAGLSYVWTPHNPYEIDMGLKLRPPGDGYRLGTDPFGRDVADVRRARAQLGDLLCVRIDAHDPRSRLGEPDRQRQPDVPRPDHRHIPCHAQHCTHGTADG